MSADAIMRGVAGAGAAAGQAAVAQASVALAGRLLVEFPDITTDVTGGDVRLRAPGLVARAFGSRHRTADPRLAGLLTMGGG
jgi:hypothetical protein